MVPMTFIWWIYHFWARFWPYFNFVDFRAYFGPFSLVNRDRQKMADLLRKMASNQKMQENKPTLKFNFTIEKRWPVSIFELFGPQHLSHWALLITHEYHKAAIISCKCHSASYKAYQLQFLLLQLVHFLCLLAVWESAIIVKLSQSW